MYSKRCLIIGYIQLISSCCAIHKFGKKEERCIGFGGSNAVNPYCRFGIPDCLESSLANRFPEMYNGLNTAEPGSLDVYSFCRAGIDGKKSPGFRVEWTPPQHTGARDLGGFEVQLQGPEYKCAVVLLEHNLADTEIPTATFFGEFLNVQRMQGYTILINSLPKNDSKLNKYRYVTSQTCVNNTNTSKTWKPVNLRMTYNVTSQSLLISFDPAPAQFNFEAFELHILQDSLILREDTLTTNIWTIRDLEPGIYTVLIEPHDPHPFDRDKCVCKDGRGRCDGCSPLEIALDATGSESTSIRSSVPDHVMLKTAHVMSVTTEHVMLPVDTHKSSFPTDPGFSPIILVALICGSLLLLSIAGIVYKVIKIRANREAPTGVDDNEDTTGVSMQREPFRQQECPSDAWICPRIQRNRIQSSTTTDSGIKSGHESFPLTSMVDSALEPLFPCYDGQQGVMRYTPESSLQCTQWVNLPETYADTPSKYPCPHVSPRHDGNTGRMKGINEKRCMFDNDTARSGGNTDCCLRYMVDETDTNMFYSGRAPIVLPEQLRCPDDVSFIAPSEANFDWKEDSTGKSENLNRACRNGDFPMENGGPFSTRNQPTYSCVANQVNTAHTCTTSSCSRTKAPANQTPRLSQRSRLQAETDDNSSMSSVMDKLAAINHRYQSFLETSDNEGDVYSVGVADV